MKYIYFLLIVKLSLNVEQVKAQITLLTSYDDFLTYARRGFKPNEAIRKDCDWQYALVAVSTDKNNRITDYKLLNKASDDLKNSFGYLQGYQFPEKLSINGHPVIFCITIQNENSKCGSSNPQYHPSQLLGMFFADLKPLFDKDPQLIFIPEILIQSYDYDPIR